MQNNRQIIHDDEDLTIVFHEGKSEYLLLTFGDLVTLAAGDKFYADKAITKLNINCLGFMAKRPNWFPQTSMLAAKNKISRITARFHEKIGYGGSMGGYAAIKYSGFFGFSSVLAFCPQWSIDPEECQGIRTGYEKHFTPAMKAMGIKPEEMEGEICILYDKKHPADAFQFQKIAACTQNVTGIHVAMTNHHVTSVLAGSMHLDQMLSALRLRDFGKLAQLANSIRRKSPVRTRILLARAVDKHPWLVGKIISRSRHAKELSEQEKSSLLASSITRLIINEKPEEALRLVDSNLSAAEDENLILRQCLEKQKNHLQAMAQKTFRTHHQTQVFYNPITRELTHALPGNSPLMDFYYLPVVDYLFENRRTLAVLNAGCHEICLPCGGKIKLMNPEECKPEHDIVLIREIDENKLCFQWGDLYACAEPGAGKRIVFNRKNISHWEKFSISKTII